jgi:uncharacterized repeat protein (TIGR03843 family)
MNSILEHLQSGDLEVTGRLVDASNATLYANCTYDETSFPVIYKPVAGERPLWDFPDGNLAQREYAAYRISELGKFFLVPPTVLRDGPFGIGMVQQWIDIDENIDLAQFYRTDDTRLRSMALFDAVINNTDRKIGHLLPSVDGELRGCDHGVTFHEEDKLRTVLWQWADKQLSELEKIQLSELRNCLIQQPDELNTLITERECDALLLRIERLLEKQCFPAPSDEWPAVPWPPF